MYRKQLYLYDKSDRLHEAVIRNYTQKDFAGMIDIQRESFPPPYPSELWWNEKQLHNHVTLFPEGAICVEIEQQLVASMTGLMVQLDSPHDNHSWVEVTDNGYITNHNPHGNTLYIADISVRPSYRQLGLGKWMMQSMYELVVHKGLDRLLGGGRMSGYHLVQQEMSAEEYFAQVIRGERKDPVISFLLRCGRTPVGVVANYLDDEESCHYAGLMEWRNPFRVEG
ncbi:GNAT family N-acetyltransferase [Brevibacillus ginsengisoli]|uniref:GNAT family N-acetyltransferase n=1 Tax=Brevibacillus ginsengisoli TaxID=363854 RepID=UPI003CF6CC23